MLSRLMRHPAGLMRMAWGKGLLAEAFRLPAAPPVPPDYWAGRWSAPGIALVTPLLPAPAPSGARRGAAPAPLALSRDGKAAACLRPAGEPARDAAPGAPAEGSRAVRP